MYTCQSVVQSQSTVQSSLIPRPTFQFQWGQRIDPWGSVLRLTFRSDRFNGDRECFHPHIIGCFPSNSDSTFKKVAKVTTLNQMKKYAMKMSLQKTPVQKKIYSVPNANIQIRTKSRPNNTQVNVDTESQFDTNHPTFIASESQKSIVER